jgi:CheY-like chemotaxis protein/two-component sensor histidine kinase
MVRLIDDLMDVSRISRGKIQLQRERVTLTAVVNQALETANPYCAQTGHRPNIDLPSEPIYLDADVVRLAQVFANLINNACKFTPSGGQISLRAERSNNEAIVRIQDTGIGIPPDKLPRIFDLFSQVHKALDSSREGLGIGLNLVKNLVELHGGSVEAYSGGRELGTEFVVHLPIAEQHTTIEHKQLDGSCPVVDHRRILVVDDNVDAAASLAMLLKRLGHDVEMAHDGLQAIDTAAAFRPEVVLMDIGLPRMNGYDAGRVIRANCNGNLLMIALTGWGQADDRSRSQAAGFDAHLVKPVDINALAAILNRRNQTAHSL